MKKTICIICFILLIGASITFISHNKKQNQQNGSEVVFWTLQLSAFDTYVKNIIAEFEKENPGVKIKWIDVPYSEGEKRTLAAVLTDNPPDLVNLTPDFSLLLAKKHALYFIDEKDLTSYLPSVLNMLKYDNKYFGIPFYATSAVTLYNKSITDKAGLKKLPITYDDLFAIKLGDSSHFITMINFAENDTLLKILNKYNINSPQTITSEESKHLFKEFKRLYDENLVPKESVTQTHRDALEKYMSGQIAFLVTGANFINMIKENAPTVYKNTGIINQLTGSSNLYDYSLMNFVIPSKSRNKENAVKFALYFTNAANQLKFAKLTTVLPVNAAALKDAYFKKTASSDITELARILSAEQLNRLQPPIPNISSKKELNTLSADNIQSILINNEPIDKSLENFARNWQKL